MTLGFLTHGFRISGKKFLAALLLFFPSFAWFYIMNILVYEFSVGIQPETSPMVFIGEALFLLSIFGSAIIGSMISERLNRRRFLGFWILFGVLTTTSFAVFEDPTIFIILSILAGASFGIGFPSCLAFITDSTVVEERARVSGAAMLITFIIIPIISGILSPFGLIEALILTAIFRAISFFALLIDPCEKASDKKKTWKAVFTTHGFGFYFISWLMFWGAGGLTAFVEAWLPGSPEWAAIEGLGLALNWIVGVAIIGFLSGFASDFFGRRKIIMFGLISLGISYAVFGVTLLDITYYLTQIFFGASWGIMFSNFFMTVLGDLASKGSKERFFAAGSIFLILPSSIQLLAKISGISVESYVISSMLSFILFVAVIPLLYAPETMPREKIRARRFKKYLRKVKKLVEEEETRNHE